jgi:hypothetical protein
LDRIERVHEGIDFVPDIASRAQRVSNALVDLAVGGSGDTSMEGEYVSDGVYARIEDLLADVNFCR